jgi:hypothetical protein
MRFIHLHLPDQNTILVNVESINSIAFEEPHLGRKGILIMTINGWKGPYSYEGDAAKAAFDKLKNYLNPDMFIG